MKSGAIGKRKETFIAMAILTVLIAVTTLTSVGYIRTANRSVNIVTVFVVIGAIRYGKYCGAYLGAVFGISSFIQCFFPSFDIGQSFIQINPYHTFLVCVLPRVLMGFCCSIIYKLFRQNCSRNFSYVVASFIGGFLNTLFVSLSLLLSFYKSDYVQSLGSYFTQMVRTLITFNSYLEWIICTVVGSLVLYILSRLPGKNNGEAS